MPSDAFRRLLLMPADRPGGTEGAAAALLARLADALAEAGSGDRPAPRELAELLWLAGRMEPPSTQSPTPTPTPVPAPGDDNATPDRPPVPERQPEVSPAPSPPPPPERHGADPRVPLHLPGPAGDPGPGPSASGPRHVSLLAPAPPMLRHPLALQRALRPLKRRADAPVGRELDERATADRIARLDADPRWWLPVLRPARERWLRLHLVHDTGPTMPLWRPLVRELHRALAQSGVFRTVTLHAAGPDGSVRGQAAHAPADGRTVTLVISDCMGPQWRRGPAGDRWYRTLRRWARRMPLAVLQPLPEHLWRDTALPAVPGRLSAPHPAAPAASLTFTPYDPPEAGPGAGVLPLPVLEPDAGWLANWAALVAAPGGTGFPAAVASLGPAPPDGDGDRTDLTRLTPEELVRRFRSTASPEAFRLAGHVAVGRPALPVMRLVQAAVEPDPRPQHLAEVVLSGMLTAVAGPPGTYAFRPGVRALLLRGLPRSDRGRTTELLARVGGLIDSRAGRAPGEFAATAPAADGTAPAPDGEAFATVSPGSVRRLGGGAGGPGGPEGPGPDWPEGLARRFRAVRRLTATGPVWQVTGSRLKRTMALRTYARVTDPARGAAFERDALLLRKVRHNHLVAVHGHGIEDDMPYLVMEFVEGLALGGLAAPYGYRLPVPLFVSLAGQLASALKTLHAAGLTHGGVIPSRVVLQPDGAVKLSPFEPGRGSGPAERSEDLRALGELLLQLACGTSRVHLPIEPSSLTHLPTPLRARCAEVLDQLMSPSPRTQAEGRDRLIAWDGDDARDWYTQRRYLLLGPVRMGSGPALPPVDQAMLAMLLFQHGRTVTHDELRQGIWDSPDEPGNTVETLDVMAALLRTLLGPEAALSARPDGYALHISADHLDVTHCEDLVWRAERSRTGGELIRAHAEIAEALALWRSDTPLEGVPGPAARTARARLVQLRLGLLRTRAELDLDLGEVERAAADLAVLVDAHPSHEDFRRLYLIALRRRGRGREALEVFEEYELSGGTSPDLLALGHELREELGEEGAEREDSQENGEHPPDTLLVFQFTDGARAADLHALLGRALTRLVAAAGLSQAAFPPRAHAGGYSLPCGPGRPVPDLLRTAVEGFPGLLRELGGARLGLAHVTDAEDWAEALTALDRSETQGLIVVPPAVRARLDGGRGPLPVILPERSKPLPPVRGPYPLPPHLPEPPHAAPSSSVTRTVVRTGDRYYEVDLTERRSVLEESVRWDASRHSLGARGSAVWRIVHPETYVREGRADAERVLRTHLRDALRRVTLRGFPTDAALAQRLSPDAVPGCTVRWDIALRFAPPVVSAQRALREVDAVLLFFDGTLTRLYEPEEQTDAARRLAEVVVERRSAADALAGVPLPHPDGTVARQRSERPHPLDLLDAFRFTPYGVELHVRLAKIEEAAARRAEPATDAVACVRTLTGRGLRVGIVGDTSDDALWTFVDRHELEQFEAIEGRNDRRTPLPPEPDILTRAIEELRVPASRCLVIGSAAAEQRAATAAGASFLGTDLTTLMEAARTL
ncbi:SAV_2336 N-terminal domain-related protein [Streptomyces sp. NPDC004610]|uniref:SAV_2336 N-terminal domain-related protein n=1 Tax=unclassified Streptomyces TaxID=2593676 RepID=UPI0033A01CA0